MKKRVLIIGSCVMAVTVGFTACGQHGKDNVAGVQKTANVSAAADVKIEENHITSEITENIKIDAEIQNQEATSCTIYNTAGKEFDKNTIENILWKDTTGLKREEDKEENAYCVEDAVGGSLYVYSGSLTYEKNDCVSDLSLLVGWCYGNEMREMGEEAKQAILQESTVKNAVDILNQIYPLGDGEKFFLLQGIKINMEDVIQKQKEREDSDMKTMTQDLLGSDAYYLSFAVEKQDIPLASQTEPDFVSLSENFNTETTGITIIADENGIQLLDIDGAYELTEKKNESIIVAQEAAEYVAKEYGEQISEEGITFDKVWLEYVFVSENSLTDFEQGTLQPYWIFVDSRENVAERINAVTGENFKYE